VAQNKRQHWVPQFYLKYWATAETRGYDKPQVWATHADVEEGGVFKVNTSKIAARSFLYSPPRDDGSRDHHVDERLQGLESLMAQLWPKIADDDYFMGDSFRKGMSLFLSTLLLRNPAADETNRRAHKMLVDVIDGSPKDSNGNPLLNRLVLNGKEVEFDPAGWQQFKNAAEEDHQREFVQNIQRNGRRFAELLLAKQPWSICDAKEPVFATSDHPVACWNEARKLPSLARPDTVVYFPISPTRMLIIGDSHFTDNTVHPLVPGGEGYFNQFIYREARRWLFTCCEPTVMFNNMLIHLKGLTGHIPLEQVIREALRPDES
jgi:hypothetical protein